MESCVGYGHWVIATLLDVTRQDTDAFQYAIKQMAAIPAAADALTRYTSRYLSLVVFVMVVVIGIMLLFVVVASVVGGFVHSGVNIF